MNILGGHKKVGISVAFFRQEAARLRKEFDAKISGILERIRERKLKEIKDKIQ